MVKAFWRGIGAAILFRPPAFHSNPGSGFLLVLPGNMIGKNSLHWLDFFVVSEVKLRIIAFSIGTGPSHAPRISRPTNPHLLYEHPFLHPRLMINIIIPIQNLPHSIKP
ncbi:MAG: hypothetical protein HFH92_16690, partial [Lachnospiraceae bacterium]|nr:hypothetical protein [Lachnospiraceae bacterium]